MTLTETQPLSDHVEVRIVHLDPDHPGFRDAEYRARRNAIAQIATDYRSGQPIPHAPYTEQEHNVWRTIWQALGPAHREHACAEYLACVEKLNFDADRIPQLDEVSRKVEARIFLESLARGVFLSTQYIRHHSTPLYTPEPDVARN